MNHTTRRIFKSVGVSPEINEFRPICREGFDGTSGLSIYKQIRSDNKEKDVCESCFFVTCMVPQKLSGKTEANE